MSSQVSITVREYIETYQSLVGYGPDSKCAVDLINKARIIAYGSGDWSGTREAVGLVLCNGCIVLPSHIESIRSLRACGSDYKVTYNGIPVGYEDFCSCAPSGLVSREVNRIGTPFMIGKPMPICFYAINKLDEGKIIDVSYEDSAGTHRHEFITLKYRKSERLNYTVSAIKSINKPVTNGNIAIVDGDGNVYRIDARDTRPSYPVYKVDGNLCGCKCVVATIKRRYMKYTLDSLDDMLDINPEALSNLISAVLIREKGEPNWQAAFAASVSLAMEFLRQERTISEGTENAMHPVNEYTITDELTCPGGYVY
jgi:hypothetical protein